MDIKELRKEMDVINISMCDMLKRRLSLSKEIGLYKKENNLPIKDEEREREIIQKMKEQMGSPYEEETEEFFRLLFKLSCDIQGKFIK